MEIKRSSLIFAIPQMRASPRPPLLPPPPTPILEATSGEATRLHKGGGPLKCECTLTTVDRVGCLEARQ